MIRVFRSGAVISESLRNTILHFVGLNPRSDNHEITEFNLNCLLMEIVLRSLLPPTVANQLIESTVSSNASNTDPATANQFGPAFVER